jgi:hypothetical protein
MTETTFAKASIRGTVGHVFFGSRRRSIFSIKCFGWRRPLLFMGISKLSGQTINLLANERRPLVWTSSTPPLGMTPYCFRAGVLPKARQAFNLADRIGPLSLCQQRLLSRALGRVAGLEMAERIGSCYRKMAPAPDLPGNCRSGYLEA